MNSKGLKSTSGNLRALPSVTLLVYHCSYLPPMFWNSGVVHQWFFSLSKGVKPSQVLAFLTTQLCKWITHRSLQLPLLPSYFQSRWRKKLQHNLMNIQLYVRKSSNPPRFQAIEKGPYLPSIVPRFEPPPKLIRLTSHINLPRFDPRAGIHPRANIKAIHLSITAWLTGKGWQMVGVRTDGSG